MARSAPSLQRLRPLIGRWSGWAVALALIIGVAACDGPFEPRVEDGDAFALYGTLDGRTSSQALRVQDLGANVLDTPDRLPATVTSTELSSNRTTVWRDSVVTLPGGVRAHLFVANLSVAAGEAHRIEAVRDADGARSSVTVTLPSPTVTSGPPLMSESALAPVIVQIVDALLADAQVRYLVRRPQATESLAFAVLLIPQETRGRYLADLGTAESRARRLVYEDTTTDPIVLLDAQLEGLARSAVPAQVDNGEGSVGWVTPISARIPFSAEAVTRVGFVDGR